MRDPINLEIMKNLFASVAEEMGVRLQRAAYSPNIKERCDFSCALFDEAGRLYTLLQSRAPEDRAVRIPQIEFERAASAQAN